MVVIHDVCHHNKWSVKMVDIQSVLKISMLYFYCIIWRGAWVFSGIRGKYQRLENNLKSFVNGVWHLISLVIFFKTALSIPFLMKCLINFLIFPSLFHNRWRLCPSHSAAQKAFNLTLWRLKLIHIVCTDSAHTLEGTAYASIRQTVLWILHRTVVLWYCGTRAEHVNKLYWQNTEFIELNLVVLAVATGLWSV